MKFKMIRSMFCRVVSVKYSHTNLHPEKLRRGLHITDLKLLRSSLSKQPVLVPEVFSPDGKKIEKENMDSKVFDPVEPTELVDIGRNLAPSYNFASYVNQSPSLQKLVHLGVDLSSIEKRKNIAEFILRLDFERDVKPYVQFLHDIRVNADEIGAILTKNMLICRESIDNLKTRINYLESKKFTPEMIAAIVRRNPLWLTTQVSLIDDRLGWFQKNYNLTGDEVRSMVNALPQIVTYDLHSIKLKNFVFEVELEMNKSMIKSLLLKRPRLFVKSQHKLLAAFEYVHNVMRVPLDRICAQPDILMQRTSTIKERHLFLQSLGRAQYNPKLPGYISLDALTNCDDNEFSINVAKSSPLTYDLFLKTL